MDDHSDDFGRPKAPRIEVYAGVGRRRWDDALKAQIVAESLEPDAIVTHVARRHGCRPQQVHDWRRLARQGVLVLPGAMAPPMPPPPLFVPLLAEAAACPPSKPPTGSGDIVIEVDGAIVHVRGRPDGETLCDVFAALRKTRAC